MCVASNSLTVVMSETHNPSDRSMEISPTEAVGKAGTNLHRIDDANTLISSMKTTKMQELSFQSPVVSGVQSVYPRLSCVPQTLNHKSSTLLDTKTHMLNHPLLT